MKLETQTMSELEEEQVRTYVVANYFHLKNTPVIITSHDNHYRVRVHEDSSPLILGKGIITVSKNKENN